MIAENNKYIWLFGENLGETANNNSFYFWKHIVEKHDEVDAYFIAQKVPDVLRVYNRLDEKVRKYFVWRNSKEHILLYFKADMYLVSVSDRDVQPDKVLFKSFQPLPTAPLIYLQHGVLAMKRLGYESAYANNTLFRFIVYNPTISEKLMQYNGFKQYQIYDGIRQPRYSELARRQLRYRKKRKADLNSDNGGIRIGSDAKNILWFITWREYFGDNEETEAFVSNINRVLCNNRFRKYLTEHNDTLTICLHRFFLQKHVERLKKALKGISNVRIVYAKNADVMNMIVSNDILITDYSSIGFDFTFLEKPVILYQPDLKAYTKQRSFYCSEKELKEVNIETPSELVDLIINEKFSVNTFFKGNMHSGESLKDVAGGKYNERLFNYLYQMEEKSIAFFGYDFSGIGGTVSATKALAEGLLEKGYLVRAYTLKQMRNMDTPAGLAITPATRQYQRKLSNRIIEKAFFLKKHYRYMASDPAKEAMKPFVGIMMDYWMKNVHASVIVSTRESIHLFFLEASSPFIKEKIYFFHTTSKMVDELFPGVLSKIQEAGIEKAAFVTERNRKALLEEKGFSNYSDYGIICNSLDSSRCISFEEIGKIGKDVLSDTENSDRLTSPECQKKAVQNVSGMKEDRNKQKIYCTYMLRISNERKSDLDNLLSFANYLKEIQETGIVINVFGDGNYVETFTHQVKEKNLESYIVYKGETMDIKQALSECDIVVDFSNAQSFGMVYIEGILNGKMVLCRHNDGSDEVMKEIPEAFYNSNEELLKKIYDYKSVDVEVLKRNYQLISSKYSREVVANDFLSLVMRENDTISVRHFWNTSN